MVADLRYGDVIEFMFGGRPVRAMVIATKGDEVLTDEGTTALGDAIGAPNIVVLGLTSHEDAEPYHRVRATASFTPDQKTYEVLS